MTEDCSSFRVAQIVAPAPVGGLESVVGELISAALVAGQPMCCLMLLPDTATVPPAFAELAERGADIVRISAPHRQYRRQYRALMAELRSRDIQLLHSHGYHADVLTSFCARALRVPHVSTLHGFVGATRRGRLYEKLQLLALRGSAEVVAVSDSVAQHARKGGLAAGQLHVVANAAPESPLLSRAEARQALHLPMNGTVVGWVGRMSGEKDPVAFVHVLARLERDAAVQGVMLGDGDLMANVKSAIAESDHLQIRLAGVVPSAGRLVAAFDALVLTSLTEGTPMVVLEAMRAGVPVVSTAVGGVPSLLANGAGTVVPYGNIPALANALQAVLDDSELSARCAQVAAERVRESYSRSAWFTRHASLYRAVLQQKIR